MAILIKDASNAMPIFANNIDTDEQKKPRYLKMNKDRRRGIIPAINQRFFIVSCVSFLATHQVHTASLKPNKISHGSAKK